MSIKAAAIAVLAAVVSFAVGWLSAASGRAALATESNQNALRAQLTDVRAHVFEARVEIYKDHPGDAIVAFEEARTAIGHAQAGLRASHFADAAKRLDAVSDDLHEAERLTGLFDPKAHDAAEQALKELAGIVAM